MEKLTRLLLLVVVLPPARPTGVANESAVKPPEVPMELAEATGERPSNPLLGMYGKPGDIRIESSSIAMVME